jgi:hypothetical protein
MPKSISAQVRDKIKEASEKAGQNGVPADAAEAVGFIASATPAPDEPAVSADAPDAPEASDATPLGSAPAADTPSEAAPASEETKSPSSSSSTAPSKSSTITPATATATDEEEWEDAEWDDDSVGVKYRIKAPKGSADKIKSGWMAHADYSRKAARLAHFQAEFQPLIESGYMDKVLPLYRALDRDEVLAQAVAQLYQQRMSNQPLTYVQPGFEQQFQPQAQPQQQEDQAYGDDPYLTSIMQPIRSELGQLRSTIEEQARASEQQRLQAQQAEAARSAQLAEWSQIHQRLHQAYPQDFSGDQRDLPKLQQLSQYADRAGYSRESHGWFGRIAAAKQDIDRYTPRAGSVTPQNGTAATPSAGAAAVQARAEEIARKARAEVANGTVVSGSSQPAEPPPPKPPKTRDKAGAPLPVKQAMRNIINSAKARAEASA